MQLIAAKFRAVQYKRLIINSSSVLWVMNLIEHVATPQSIPTSATLLLMALRKSISNARSACEGYVISIKGRFMVINAEG